MNPILEELRRQCAQAVQGLRAQHGDDFKSERPTCPRLKRSDVGRLVAADYFPSDEEGLVMVEKLSRRGRWVLLRRAGTQNRQWFDTSDITVKERIAQEVPA